jgi:alpha-L-arabinofuranosidase
LNEKVIAGQDSLYASAVVDTAQHELIIKIAHTKAGEQGITIDMGRQLKKGINAMMYTLANTDLETVNEIDEPKRISPQKTQLPLQGNQLRLQLPGYAFVVLKIPLQ